MPAARECFREASSAFSELVSAVKDDQWTRPGLGIWDLRSLVGHTSRALSTIDAYLDKPAGPATLQSPVAYFLAVRSADPQAVAQRGQEAGKALGSDPSGYINDLRTRVAARVDRADDDRTLETPAGSIRLADYLPTRTFELVVHSLDIAKSTDNGVPAGLAGPIAACCELVGQLAARLPEAPDLLMVLTGRPPLNNSPSVV